MLLSLEGAETAEMFHFPFSYSLLQKCQVVSYISIVNHEIPVMMNRKVIYDVRFRRRAKNCTINKNIISCCKRDISKHSVQNLQQV
jgi:hypothetical protein